MARSVCWLVLVQLTPVPYKAYAYAQNDVQVFTPAHGAISAGSQAILTAAIKQNDYGVKI